VVDVRGDDGAAARNLVADEIGRQSLAEGDELHLRRDLAFARVVQLGHGLTRSRGCAPRRDPRLAQFRQTLLRVVPLRAAGVVNPDRRLATRQCDLAHRDAHVHRTVDVDLL
jgi:hypothetical protein